MVKFVLLGHRRSGSTLMLCGLAGHRNVYMFGELFNEHEDDRRKAFASGLRGCSVAERRGMSESGFYRDGQDGAQFLRDFVFYEHYWQPVAVGFKLFYHQARDTGGARRAWEYLIAHKDIHVIHLVRRNMLESMLSLRIAFQTNEWASLTTEAPAPTEPLAPLHFSPQECEGYFTETGKSQQWARAAFSDHPSIEVEYEGDLCRRFQATMHRVQDFLGVPRRRSRRLLRKQARRRPAEQISNYAELKAHFAPTPYARWFE